MFITEAFAAAETAATATTAAAEPSPMASFLIQLILVFAIFYFVLIRPQQKKMRERDNMLNAIQPKDEIITGGGVYAKVVKADGDILTVEIAEGVRIKVSRSSVRETVSDKTTK